MEWNIVGRDMHVLCRPSTESPDSLIIDDSRGGQEVSLINNVITSTYDFATLSDHPDAKYIATGNYIAFKDKYGKCRLYTIMTVDGDNELDVHCEDIGLDLINEDADPWDLTGNPQPIEKLLTERVLQDTGWVIGINEISGRSRATKFESLTDSQFTRIGSLMKAFDAECDFEISLDGSKVTKQVINIYETVGEDCPTQRFVEDVNLKALRVSESIEDLCTCIRCYGRENTETKKRTTISEIEYDDGRYYSPKGHIRIYDREARNKWSRFRAYNYNGQGEFDGYINGTFEYDTDNVQELFNRGLKELKDRNEKKVSYEADLYDLQADIGDTVEIASYQKEEPVYLSARIQSVKNHYSVSGEDTGILANYKLLESAPAKSVEDMMSELRQQIVIVTGATVVYQKGESGTTAPTGNWTNTIPSVPAGQFLWTKTITTYSDGSETIAYSVSRNGEAGKDGNDGKDGEDAITLQILSSNGNLFKDSLIATSLIVTIIVSGEMITSSAEMKKKFGDSAIIRWEQKRFGQDEFEDLNPNDPRLSDDGFILTLDTKDVFTHTVFNCSLDY